MGTNKPPFSFTIIFHGMVGTGHELVACIGRVGATFQAGNPFDDKAHLAVKVRGGETFIDKPMHLMPRKQTGSTPEAQPEISTNYHRQSSERNRDRTSRLLKSYLRCRCGVKNGLNSIIYTHKLTHFAHFFLASTVLLTLFNNLLEPKFLSLKQSN